MTADYENNLRNFKAILEELQKHSPGSFYCQEHEVICDFGVHPKSPFSCRHCKKTKRVQFRNTNISIRSYIQDMDSLATSVHMNTEDINSHQNSSPINPIPDTESEISNNTISIQTDILPMGYDSSDDVSLFSSNSTSSLPSSIISDFEEMLNQNFMNSRGEIRPLRELRRNFYINAEPAVMPRSRGYGDNDSEYNYLARYRRISSNRVKSSICRVSRFSSIVQKVKNWYAKRKENKNKKKNGSKIFEQKRKVHNESEASFFRAKFENLKLRTGEVHPLLLRDQEDYEEFA